MMFGVREICDVVLRAKSKMTLGNRTFYKNEPVIYFDTLKTSTLESSATTVYATGGRGNARLVAWEGERTVTFTFEDALISPEGFAILSGAGLIDATQAKPIYVHTTSQVKATRDTNGMFVAEIEDKDNNIMIAWADGGITWDKNGTAQSGVYKVSDADMFCMLLDEAGEVYAEPCKPMNVEYIEETDEKNAHFKVTCYAHNDNGGNGSAATVKTGETEFVVLIDYYVIKAGDAKQIEITADKFAGNYYLEASTLFRRESDGVDMPAEFIIPNGKIQSNFSFAMASSGDPSTFTFTMDAFPDYTKFDPEKKVIAAIQVITDESTVSESKRTKCSTTQNQGE